MSAVELYQKTVRSMPPSERLRLASLILNDLAPTGMTVDESDEWTDEDLADATRASLSHFIAEKVEAGEFPSAEAVVKDVLTRMMRDEHELTDEDVDAINRAEEEMDRGELVDFDAFAANMREKYRK